LKIIKIKIFLKLSQKNQVSLASSSCCEYLRQISPDILRNLGSGEPSWRFLSQWSTPFEPKNSDWKIQHELEHNINMNNSYTMYCLEYNMDCIQHGLHKVRYTMYVLWRRHGLKLHYNHVKTPCIKSFLLYRGKYLNVTCY
jgi:hypothetical protein